VRQIPLSMGIAWMFALLFSSRFLDTRKALPRAHRIIRGFILWGVFVCAMALVGSYRISIINATLFVGLGAIVLLVIAVVAVMQGNRPARYFLLAWTILLLGVIVYILRTIGILPTNTFTEFTMVWGSASEAILLSVALAARLRAMKEQQEQAQHRQLQAQHALFSTQREKLEAQRALNAVQQEALEAERKAHDELKATQAHLIQQEKMASLGLLSAGIAHEIKNPINFMKISNQTLEARVTDLQAFITDLLSEETDETLREAFTQRFDGLHSQIALIKEGSERVQAIIAGMRSASRRDEAAGKQPIDPTEGLRSTVELVKASWKSLVDFDVSGLSAGARVSGHASALNQVFTNLMVNAAQAIEDRLKADPTGPRGTIRIGSRIERDCLLMDFEDNGGGMSEEVRSKLFTPFFTTKDRERGTGLGMGICLGILEEHGGRLLVESTIGKGSVFSVSLPLLQT
jgi:two-component system NtrC family sensor kinase